jgi:hypothetical protein
MNKKGLKTQVRSVFVRQDVDMSKLNKKDTGETFTIQFDQVNDSSEIPGIAELLGSKTSAKQSAQDKTTVMSGVKFNRNSIGSTLKSLKEFGTRLEIHFLLNDDRYIYIQHSDLSHSKFFGLDELFHEMKISMFFIQEFGVFGEIKQADKPYLFDAFGINEQQFMQFVLNQKNKILTVYVSEKSMLAKKDDVIAYTENKNQNLSASGLDLNTAA